MKKVIGIILALSVVLAFTACETTGQAPATTQPAAAAASNPYAMPDWVLKARRDAPEDALVGIGTARMATQNQSMTMSETRARTQIVRAMNSMVQNMVNDYTVSSELDPSAAFAFQEEVTRTLAQAQLSGAYIQEQNFTADGTCWTVIWLTKTNVVREINQAQTLAKLAVPAALAFDAASRMDDEFAKAAEQDWVGNE